MSEQFFINRREQLRVQLRQLILLRETGPKSSAWHAARMRLIWRLHDKLRPGGEETGTEEREPSSANGIL